MSSKTPCIDCALKCRGVRCRKCVNIRRSANRKQRFCADCGIPISLPSKRCHLHAHEHRQIAFTPSSEKWIATAREEAAKVRVTVRLVLSGDKRLRPLLARHRAWGRLLSEGYSLSGISRASGFHHTSILIGERRLAAHEARFEAHVPDPIITVSKPIKLRIQQEAR